MYSKQGPFDKEPSSYGILEDLRLDGALVISMKSLVSIDRSTRVSIYIIMCSHFTQAFTHLKHLIHLQSFLWPGQERASGLTGLVDSRNFAWCS